MSKRWEHSIVSRGGLADSMGVIIPEWLAMILARLGFGDPTYLLTYLLTYSLHGAGYYMKS
jgi:hypothetical protein